MTIGAITKALTNPSDDFVTQFPWKTVGSIIAEQVTLTGANLADAVVEALDDDVKAILYPENGAVATEFRFWAEGAIANETAILDVYAAAGVDVYTKIGEITLTIGTARNGAADKLFVDGIAESGVAWLTDTKVVQVNNNTIARWVINMHGYDRFVFIATGGTMDLDPAVAGVADDTLHIESRRI